jgi:AcrR family transcriptional regulator
VTTAARRDQILEATIALIGEVGYAQASFARIAERAGLSSTRLISYHFAGKADLMAALVARVTGEIGAAVGARVAAAPDPAAMLEAYIRGVLAFIRDHPARMSALMSVFLEFRTDTGGRSYEASDEASTVSHVERLLEAGQAAGQFRMFDPYVMASTIQRAVDGVPFLLQMRPDLDLDAYADELVELFTRATRA